MNHINRRRFIKIGTFFSIGLPFISKGIGLTTIGDMGYNIKEKLKDDLYNSFRLPNHKFRPFVRWWWNGDRIESKEIIRELDLLKKAGIGGVEINPIRFPGSTDTLGIRPLTYLSDEWIAILKLTLQEAKKKDISCDMIVGSGWPYGGDFLSRDDQIKMVALGTKDLQGEKTYRFTRQELLDDVSPPIMSQYGDELKELMSVILVPYSLNDLSDCVNLSVQMNQDTITVKVPPGKFELYYLVKLTGYMAVINGAPGAKGPVLDHYNKQAVEKYLNRISDKLSARIGFPGNHFRAFFTDSLELEGANWCEDMFSEFLKRKKYDLEPYFPFILFKVGHMGNALNEKYGSEFSPAMKDDIERVRYDFEHVRVELFKERFIDTFVNWCKKNGVQSRMQAYGRPCNPLEASMSIDIPECETWMGAEVGKVFSDENYRQGRAYSMINKYVSSAAHLSGKQLVSCEEMTNTSMVFNASLNDIKVAGDQSILSGVTHSVLHGFNYSPPKAPFPGWVRYGTFFNERNTWWRFFKNWVDYKTRLYAIFQQAEMQADIAILPPLADLSGKYGFQRDPFPSFAYPEYLFQIWEAVHQNGNGCDYVTEDIIQQSKVKDGYLSYGTRCYNALLVVDAESMLPDTAMVLSRFKSSGGKLIFIEAAPYRTPEKKRSSIEIKKAKALFKELVPGKEEIVAAPKQNFISWYQGIQLRFNLRPYVKMTNPDKFTSQIYYKHKDLDIFFFSNYSEQKSHQFEAEFNIPGKTAWLWDPETGNRLIYPTPKNSKELLINLGPSESKLIVFDKQKAEGKKYILPAINEKEFITITGPWEITLKHVNGKTESLVLNNLVDFSKEKKVKEFAGTIIYENEFSVNDKINISYLSLGKVYDSVAETEINNRNAGLVWYGSPLYNISEFVKHGKNSIRIKITTTLGNYVKSLTDNQVAQNWTKNQPLNLLGLMGPVKIFYEV